MGKRYALVACCAVAGSLLTVSGAHAAAFAVRTQSTYGQGASFAGVATGADGQWLLHSLVVVIIGGLGSIKGAVAGSLLYGLVTAFAPVYLPNDYTYYSVRISKDNYSNRRIYLNNFYGANVQVYAYVDYTKITIPSQVVDGYEIEGTGTLHGSDLSLNYRVKDWYHNSVTDFCETWGEKDW